MKLKLISLIAGAMLLLTGCPTISTPTPTSLAVVQLAVTGFVDAMDIYSKGTWTYGTLTEDMASCATKWNADTTSQKVTCVQTLVGDITSATNCDTQCKEYAKVASDTLTGVLNILLPPATSTVASMGAVPVAVPPPDPKVEGAALKALVKTQKAAWDKVAPAGAKSKDIQKKVSK